MVILDMIMPDIGGGEIYDKLKEINSGIRVLLSGGYSIDGLATEILNKGSMALHKNHSMWAGFLKKIREILSDLKSQKLLINKVYYVPTI